jgi:hypothetical protein
VDISITTQYTVAIGLHIDQAHRLHWISKWEGPDAFLLSAFRRGQERFRENHVAVPAPGSFNLFKDRFRHGLIAAAKDNIECHHAGTEFSRLADDSGGVLILEFECR